jgi:hypothetical protein
MDTELLPTKQELEEMDLADPSLWKPIYAEMLRLQQAREITGGLLVAIKH